jgi:hypothetical protein
MEAISSPLYAFLAWKAATFLYMKKFSPRASMCFPATCFAVDEPRAFTQWCEKER